MRKSDRKPTWIALGVEIAADRQVTWGCLAGVTRPPRVVVVELQPPLAGTGSAGQIEVLWARHELEAICLDPRSPSATLTEALTAQSLPLRLADAVGMTTAHGRFTDLLNAGLLRTRGHPGLDEAVRAAASRSLAGAVALERYVPGVDMAPLMAAELACWGLPADLDDAEGTSPGVWVI